MYILLQLIIFVYPNAIINICVLCPIDFDNLDLLFSNFCMHTFVFCMACSIWQFLRFLLKPFYVLLQVTNLYWILNFTISAYTIEVEDFPMSYDNFFMPYRNLQFVDVLLQFTMLFAQSGLAILIHTLDHCNFSMHHCKNVYQMYLKSKTVVCCINNIHSKKTTSLQTTNKNKHKHISNSINIIKLQQWSTSTVTANSVCTMATDNVWMHCCYWQLFYALLQLTAFMHNHNQQLLQLIAIESYDILQLTKLLSCIKNIRNITQHQKQTTNKHQHASNKNKQQHKQHQTTTVNNMQQNTNKGLGSVH